MSTAHNFEPRYTVSDYLKWDGDWELWNGYPVSMSTSPFVKHQVVAGKLYTSIQNQLADSGSACHVLHEIDWIVDDATVVRPNMVIICDNLPEKHIEKTPTLVVEILSKSTRSKDLGPKRELYFSHHVPFYLIVDPDEKSVTLLERSADEWAETSAQLQQTIELNISSDCQIKIQSNHLFD